MSLTPAQWIGVVTSSSPVVDADAELMLRFQAGEVACFEELVQRHRRGVFSFVYRMIQNAPASEDLAQETFLRVYTARERYRPDARFTTWLYRIASRLALNYLRDHRRDRQFDSLDQPFAAEEGAPRELPSGVPSAEANMIEQERRRVIQKSIAALPERQRAAVIMHKYQGLDYKEIGKALKLSESATKSLLFRAYESLRRQLQALL